MSGRRLALAYALTLLGIFFLAFGRANDAGWPGIAVGGSVLGLGIWLYYRPGQ